MAQQLTDEDIEYAYKVIDALTQGLDHVATNPEKTEQLELEFVNKMPDLFEALMILLPVEHRGLIFELFKSTGRYARTWIKQMMKKKRQESQ